MIIWVDTIARATASAFMANAFAVRDLLGRNVQRSFALARVVARVTGAATRSVDVCAHWATSAQTAVDQLASMPWTSIPKAATVVAVASATLWLASAPASVTSGLPPLSALTPPAPKIAIRNSGTGDVS